jgi:hypothetical protein
MTLIPVWRRRHRDALLDRDGEADPAADLPADVAVGLDAEHEPAGIDLVVEPSAVEVSGGELDCPCVRAGACQQRGSGCDGCAYYGSHG